ncbi:hypothetical protein CPB84DRAFT_953074 [Gymnopilus junonius]|uniref:Uncharacterized protein n=1 Tax=Gymnopilus junonius TaxID=109634 RepID=A0A9P5NRS2_GYMJU|nr:hypothetical protein CPB84DRAFT_953074 [Gymnopilus junonius]
MLSPYIPFLRSVPLVKAKDIETLALAVRRENERLQAYKRTQAPDSNLDLDKNLEELDWTTIAEKVSDSSSVKRTPTECRVIWVGDQHPSLNHGQWPNSELDKLNAIVQEYTEKKNPVDWVNVAELLGNNRTPIDCMRHGTPQHRHNWTAEADQKLLHAVECSGIDNWQLVARKVSEYVTPSQCQGRWQKTLNPALKRRTWTIEEDERLRKAVAGYGNSWVQVAAAIPGRTNDQCRERWTEYLRPCATGVTWTEAEDIRLLELVEKHGNKWALISSTIGNNKTGQNVGDSSSFMACGAYILQVSIALREA